MTIRNVVVGRARPDADLDELRRGLAGILALELPGLLANDAGLDAGLREGGWSFAITNLWADEAAYRVYDADPEHNRWRAVIGAQCEQIARVQFDL